MSQAAIVENFSCWACGLGSTSAQAGEFLVPKLAQIAQFMEKDVSDIQDRDIKKWCICAEDAQPFYGEGALFITVEKALEEIKLTHEQAAPELVTNNLPRNSLGQIDTRQRKIA